jgi:hypothetical protein
VELEDSHVSISLFISEPVLDSFRLCVGGALPPLFFWCGVWRVFRGFLGVLTVFAFALVWVWYCIATVWLLFCLRGWGCVSGMIAVFGYALVPLLV